MRRRVLAAQPIRMDFPRRIRTQAASLRLAVSDTMVDPLTRALATILPQGRTLSHWLAGRSLGPRA